jgi:hypothetical protein
LANGGSALLGFDGSGRYTGGETAGYEVLKKKEKYADIYLSVQHLFVKV